MANALPVIDRRDAVDLFHALLRGDDGMRVIRILGDAKMGKTHLMSRVFPAIVREDPAATCVQLDMRNPRQSVADYLHALHDWLGGDRNFPTYAETYRAWITRPRVEVEGVKAALARVTISAPEAAEQARQYERELSSNFVDDLARFSGQTVVLLFDAVNEANEDARTWLCDMFLGQLVRLDHVRAVISGHSDSVPEPAASYASRCESFELRPVMDLQEYITFCRARNYDLPDTSIRDFARAIGYKPGLFVDMVNAWRRQGGAYG